MAPAAARTCQVERLAAGGGRSVQPRLAHLVGVLELPGRACAAVRCRSCWAVRGRLRRWRWRVGSLRKRFKQEASGGSGSI